MTFEQAKKKCVQKNCITKAVIKFNGTQQENYELGEEASILTTMSILGRIVLL